MSKTAKKRELDCSPILQKELEPEFRIGFEPEMFSKSDLPVWASILIIALTAIIVIGSVGWGAYKYLYHTPAELPITDEQEFNQIY